MSKVFGEALGSLYADKYGMEVFCMRIGNVNPVPIDKRRLSIWFSPRDLAQLVTIGIEHPGHPLRDRLRRFGQQAQLVRQLERVPPGLPAAGRQRALRRRGAGEGEAGHDPRAEMYQGGNFVSAEIGGDPSRATPKVKRKKR